MLIIRKKVNGRSYEWPPNRSYEIPEGWKLYDLDDNDKMYNSQAEYLKSQEKKSQESLVEKAVEILQTPKPIVKKNTRRR